MKSPFSSQQGIAIDLNRKEDSESRVLPLINVVFLLLIFFMVAGNLTVKDPFTIKELKSQSEINSQPPLARVLMGKGGKLALESEVMDKATLISQLTSRLEAQPDLRIQLKADAELTGNEVILLLESLREIGIDKLHLMAVTNAL